MRRCRNRNSKKTRLVSPSRSVIGSLYPAKLGGFTRSEGGASAVEFALVLPLLVAMVGGIIEFGAIFFLQNNMVNVAREEARRVAIGELTETQAIASAKAGLVDWGATFQVQVVDPVTTADPNDTDVVVTITVPIADAMIIDILDALQMGDLQASVTMRSQVI